MKYLVIGTGGVGGSIGAYLALNSQDVDFIARSSHLEKMQNEGLHLISDTKGDKLIRVNAYDAESYDKKADVIFVCVKYYSIREIVSLIEKAAHKNTIVIPILNVYGTGSVLQRLLPDLKVVDGCVYIIAHVSGAAEITQKTDMFRIVFGARENQAVDKEIMKKVEIDLKNTGIDAILSEDIRTDAFKKFILISPYACCGAYYDIPASEMHKEGIYRETLKQLFAELGQLASAMGIELGFDVVERNLRLVDAFASDTISSMQRDMKNNHPSEIDGVLFEVVRKARKFGVNLPWYEKIAEKFGFKG